VSAADANKGNWDSVRSVGVGREVAVKLKNGKNVKGRYIAATESTLSMSVGGGITELARQDVKQVFVVLPRSRSKGRRIGAAIGSTLALAGVGGLEDSSGDGLPPGAAMVALGLAGAGIGAFFGTLVAPTKKRVLIYATD
jgi:hypothetical protein